MVAARGSALPFPDAVASLLKIVAEGVQPDNPAVSLEPRELPLGKLADGDPELPTQVVEGGQLAAEIARDVPVLQPQLVEPGVGHASGAQSGDLFDHAIGQALPKASFDSLLKDFAWPGQPQLQTVVARGALLGGHVRAAGRGNLDRPYDPPPVAFIVAAGGVRGKHRKYRGNSIRANLPRCRG